MCKHYFREIPERKAALCCTVVRDGRTIWRSARMTSLFATSVLTYTSGRTPHDAFFTQHLRTASKWDKFADVYFQDSTYLQRILCTPCCSRSPRLPVTCCSLQFSQQSNFNNRSAPPLPCYGRLAWDLDSSFLQDPLCCSYRLHTDWWWVSSLWNQKRTHLKKDFLLSWGIRPRRLSNCSHRHGRFFRLIYFSFVGSNFRGFKSSWIFNLTNWN